MDYLQAIVLAVIQGATEFLPISSSAHLILPHAVLGWPDQGVLFDATLHAGTLTAVVVHCRHELHAMTASVLSWRRDPAFDRACNLVVATLPLVLVGPWVIDLVDAWRGAAAIAAATVLFGLLLYASDRYATRARDTADGSLGMRGALVIGLAQVLAVFPGTSRAGITITAALFIGLARREAVNFTFLLSIPTILGAMVLTTANAEIGADYPIGALVVAFFVSATTALIGLEWFIRVVDRIGMTPFVVYRLVLGAVLASLTLTDLA